MYATNNFMKSFERTVELSSTNWGIGKDKWDALIFEPKRDIRVYAIAIHGPYDNKPRDFTIGYKYII